MTVLSVTVAKFADLCGYTAKAVRRKIESGTWMQGYEFNRSENGEVTVFVPGYERWAAGLPRVPAEELLNGLLNGKA